jgi:hypothetical protein
LEKEIEDGNGDDEDPFASVRAMLKYVSFILSNYDWLPFLQDDDLRTEIMDAFKELERLLKRGDEAVAQKDAKAIKQELRKAETLTAKLQVLLSNKHLAMLLQIRAAIAIARGAAEDAVRLGGWLPLLMAPPDTDRLGPKPGSAEALRDAAALQEGLNKIEWFLKHRKVQDATEAYEEIQDLIFKWIVKAGV